MIGIRSKTNLPVVAPLDDMDMDMDGDMDGDVFGCYAL
jgi:hypothetical protein